MVEKIYNRSIAMVGIDPWYNIYFINQLICIKAECCFENPTYISQTWIAPCSSCAWRKKCVNTSIATTCDIVWKTHVLSPNDSCPAVWDVFGSAKATIFDICKFLATRATGNLTVLQAYHASLPRNFSNARRCPTWTYMLELLARYDSWMAGSDPCI